MIYPVLWFLVSLAACIASTVGHIRTHDRFWLVLALIWAVMAGFDLSAVILAALRFV